MATPDSNTIAIVLFNAIGWVLVWLRGERRDAIQKYQHQKMWRQYEKDHGINGNGKAEEVL